MDGYTASKLIHAGLEADVIRAYKDFTATLCFDDGELLDFPLEAIQDLIREGQVTVMGAPITDEEGSCPLRPLSLMPH